MSKRTDAGGDATGAPVVIAEVFAVCAAYIVFAHFAVAKDIFGAAALFIDFPPVESVVAASFATGAIAQFAFVVLLVAVPGFPHAREAVRTLVQPANGRGWTIALCILVVEILALYLGWIRDFSKLIDLSSFGVSMSLVPALDGVTQEVVFRGYVILRLASAGTSRSTQIAISGLLFAVIHFSYVATVDTASIGSIVLSLMPLLGTFGLGAAWAFAFQQSGYKLLPVVVSHVLVIVFAQPWLAMSYGA